MMRVLHINCNYMTTSLHQTMIEHLDKFTDNSVFCPLQKGKETLTNPNRNVVVSECFDLIDRLLYFKKQGQIRAAINEAYCAEQFNMIHAYTLFTDGNCAMALSKRHGIPYIVAIRDTDVNNFFKFKPYLIPLGIKIMRNANAVFFLSESYKRTVLTRFVPKRHLEEIMQKTYVVPNGIDDFWLDKLYSNKNYEDAERRIAEKVLSVVCVGRINKRKNIPMIQKALSILRERGWNTDFRVIGKIEDISEIKKIRKDKFTTYYSPTDKEGLVKFYREADIFVLTSHTETFGLVYAEAMSQGLPVIYTRGQGFDGQFPEGEVGYAVNDKNPKEIADAIELLCSDYVRIAGNAVSDAAKFKWDDICNRYYDIYSNIVAQNDGTVSPYATSNKK